MERERSEENWKSSGKRKKITNKERRGPRDSTFCFLTPFLHPIFLSLSYLYQTKDFPPLSLYISCAESPPLSFTLTNKIKSPLSVLTNKFKFPAFIIFFVFVRREISKGVRETREREGLASLFCFPCCCFLCSLLTWYKERNKINRLHKNN